MSWLHREYFQNCQVGVSPARLWVQGGRLELPKLSRVVQPQP